MSGEGFMAADPTGAASDTISNRLGAIRAAEAGAGVPPLTSAPAAYPIKLGPRAAVETGAGPQGRWGSAPGVIEAPQEPTILVPRDAGEAGAEPQWRLGSAPHVIDAVHEGGNAR